MYYQIAASDKIEDHGHALDVWLRNFPDPTRFAKRYDWYYRCNPHLVYSFVLKDRSGPIGAAGLAERQFAGTNGTYSAGVCSDFTVDQSRRTLGPALQLQKWVIKTGLERFAFLYGFPSAGGLTVMSRAGYRKLGELVCYTMAFRSYYYLRRLIPSTLAPGLSKLVDLALLAWSKASRCFAAPDCTLEELTTFDHRFDALWEACRLKTLFTARRDRAFLQWRFQLNPTDKFRVFACSAKDQTLLGYAVVKVDKHGHWRVFDFLARGGTSLISLFAHLIEQARCDGAKSLTVSFFGNRLPHKCLRACGFVVRQHPRTIVVAGRAGAGYDQARLYDQDQWYLTPADEDYN